MLYSASLSLFAGNDIRDDSSVMTIEEIVWRSASAVHQPHLLYVQAPLVESNRVLQASDSETVDRL